MFTDAFSWCQRKYLWSFWGGSEEVQVVEVAWWRGKRVRVAKVGRPRVSRLPLQFLFHFTEPNSIINYEIIFSQKGKEGRHKQPPEPVATLLPALFFSLQIEYDA